MADCFISYSSQDEDLARYVHSELITAGVSVFMAGASLRPGDDWTDRVWEELRRSDWVVFLASRAACKSEYVLEELGHALGSSKKLVPIVWDMDPEDLPGWVKTKQAIDLRGATTLEQLQTQVAEISGRIKADKRKGLVILAAMVAGVLLIINR